MKKICILLVLFSCFSGVQAQRGWMWTIGDEGRMIISPRYKTFDFIMPQINYEFSYTPIQKPDLNIDMPEINPVMPMADRPMDMQVLSMAYRPFYNVYTPMLRHNPAFLDFHEVYIKGVSPNMAFISEGFQATWPGAGGLTTISGNMAWYNNRWTVTTGAFGGVYSTPFEIHPGYMGGFNASVSYQINDFMKANVWGQYTMYDSKGRENMHIFANPFHYQTGVGGSMDFKVTEKFSFGVGVYGQYNSIDKKWSAIPLIYPTFTPGKRMSMSVGVGHY